MPRRSLYFPTGLSPRFGLCPNVYGPKAEPGAQPTALMILNGGAEPRLTSGGEAVTLYVLN